MEYKNLSGEKMQKTYKYLKAEGCKYVVTYNPSEENLFNFIDRFFKTEAGAKKFYNSLNVDMKQFKAL